MHVVDGSDGGYTMAARGLEAQLESLGARSCAPRLVAVGSNGIGGNYQRSLPWQEFVQLRATASQPLLATSSLIPFPCVAAFTVVEL